MRTILRAVVVFGWALCSTGAPGMDFDGTTTWVEPPLEVSAKLDGASGVTVSVWVKRNPAGLDRRNEILNLTIAETRAKAVIGFLADNTIRVGARTRPEEEIRSAATVKTWTDAGVHHIVGVIDLQRPAARIYVDGVLQELRGEVAGWQATVFPPDTGRRNTLGVGSDLRNHFHGGIRDLKVFSRALEEGEIERLHVLAQNIEDDEIPSLIYAWQGNEAMAAQLARLAAKPAEAKREIPRLTEIEMVKLAGSPRQIGRIRGEILADAVRDGVRRHLERAQREDVPLKTLEFYAQPAIERLQQVAPHWLEEMRVTAETAGVDPELYLTCQFSSLLFSSRGSGWRTQCTELEHECTSYAASGKTTDQGGILWHKTRDNVPSVQRAYIVQSSLPGIYKYVQIATMAVNEKGLALSGDWGGPAPKIPRYRGQIGITRYLMEKAADCDEALAILKDFVAKGWYVGGTRIGQRWTIVDRYGRILDVTNSSDVDSLSYRYIKDGGPHITRKSAQRLLDMERPISFLDFHDVSRDTLVSTSISGCTVEVHPEYPQYLTVIWASFPARSLPFPLLTGGSKTPLALLDGTIDAVGNQVNMSFDEIRELERALYSECKQLQARLSRLLDEGQEAEVPSIIDQWVERYTERHLQALYRSHEQPAAVPAGMP